MIRIVGRSPSMVWISEILQIDSLRASVAIALQQNTLFATTIAENIAYATANVDRKAVELASKVSCADEFITETVNGYDTELGERGGKLSTGQRQRLSIARAVIRDTPILILDEPTASLDAETEHRVLANLADWGRETSCIPHNAPVIDHSKRGSNRTVGGWRNS